MWAIIISIFLLLQDANLSRAEHACEDDPRERCAMHLDIRLHVPTDADSLKLACRDYLKALDCYEEYEATCPEGYLIMFFVPFDSTMNYRLIREICDEDSGLHSGYVRHASCVESAIQSHVHECQNTSESKASEFYAYLNEKIVSGEIDIETAREDYFVLPPCLWNVYTTVCVLSQIESACGEEAAAVSKEVAEKSSFPLISCDFKGFRNIQTGFLKFLEDSNESYYLKGILNSTEILDLAKSERYAYV